LRVQAGFEVDDDLVEDEGEEGRRRRNKKPTKCPECEEFELPDDLDYGKKFYWQLPRNFFKPTGKCQELTRFDEYTGSLNTTWTVPLEYLITYPCSAGYARNFAANPELLKDVTAAIDLAGHDVGASACGNKCDINNGGYTSTTLDYNYIYGFGPRKFGNAYANLLKFKPQARAFFCGGSFLGTNYGEGALNEWWKGKYDYYPSQYDENACNCKRGKGQDAAGTEITVDYEVGCISCKGEVQFKVAQCYDPSPNPKPSDL